MLASPLGTAVTINGNTVNGIWDDDYSEILGVAGDGPLFTCDQDDLDAITPTVARGTTVTKASVNYTIQNMKPDGTGFTMLVLSKD